VGGTFFTSSGITGGVGNSGNGRTFESLALGSIDADGGSTGFGRLGSSIIPGGSGETGGTGGSGPSGSGFAAPDGSPGKGMVGTFLASVLSSRAGTGTPGSGFSAFAGSIGGIGNAGSGGSSFGRGSGTAATGFILGSFPRSGAGLGVI
jgi:hypothetical protein